VPVITATATLPHTRASSVRSDRYRCLSDSADSSTSAENCSLIYLSTLANVYVVVQPTIVSRIMKRISGNTYKEIEVDRISSGGNAIAKETCRGHHIHIIGKPDDTDNLLPGENHLVRLETHRGEREIGLYVDGPYVNGVITGFDSFEDKGVEEYISSQEKPLSSLEEGQFFKGTISEVTESGDRVIEIGDEYSGVVIVSKGEPGDEVEVRLTKTAGENLHGNVIDFCNKEEDDHQISDEERRYAQRKFKTAQYDPDKNDLLNGKM